MTYNGTRAHTFYDAEGRVSSYQNYYGPVFVNVSNIQYDSQGNMVGYTEKVGDVTKVVFNIIFDEAGRIHSQQFTDSTLQLRFGNVNTQTFTYDEKTGKLIEFKIENGDFIATFDDKGNRKSFELSVQMKAFIAEEQRKAVEAAKARARREAAREAKKRKLISRKEIIENAKGNKKLQRLLASLPKDRKGRIQLGDAEVEFLLKKSKTFRKFALNIGITKAQLKAVLNNSIRVARTAIKVSVAAIRASVAGKILATIKEAIKARAPNLTAAEILAATLVKRIEEVFEVTDGQGNIHRVTEITRLDGNSNQIERIVIDKFTFRNEQGKKVKGQIVSVYDSQDRLTKVGETYKQKQKKGTLITKRTTLFDENGEIISQKTKQDFKKSGFFNSTAGKIVGAFAIAALTIVSAGTLGPLLAGASGFLGATVVGSVTVGAVLAGAAGAFIGSTALTLLQGENLSDALISGALSAAAVIATAGIAKGLDMLGSSLTGGLGDAFKTFGKNLLTGFKFEKLSDLGFQGFSQELLKQSSLRIGATQFSETFGKELGVFGATAILSLTTVLAGGAISSSFANQAFTLPFGEFVALGLRSAAQGGIAEAFKNENGLGAQFGQELSSALTGGISKNVFNALRNTVDGVARVRQAIVELGYDPEEVGVVDLIPIEGGLRVLLTDRSGETLSKNTLTPISSAQSEPENMLNRFTTFASDLYNYLTVERTFVIGFGGAQNQSQGLLKYAGIDGWNFGAEGIAGGNPADFLNDGSGIPNILQNSKAGTLVVNDLAYERSIQLDLMAQDPFTQYTFEQDGVSYEKLNPFLKTEASIVTEFYSPNQKEAALNQIVTYAKPGDPINLVAHSIGAPDLEYVVTKLQQLRPDLRINSITLIDPVMSRDFIVPDNVNKVVLFYQTQDLQRGVLKPEHITILDNNTTNFQSFEVPASQFNRPPEDTSKYYYHEHIDNLFSVNSYIRDLIEEEKRQRYGIY